MSPCPLIALNNLYFRLLQRNDNFDLSLSIPQHHQTSYHHDGYNMSDQVSDHCESNCAPPSPLLSPSVLSFVSRDRFRARHRRTAKRAGAFVSLSFGDYDVEPVAARAPSRPRFAKLICVVLRAQLEIAIANEIANISVPRTLRARVTRNANRNEWKERTVTRCLTQADFIIPMKRRRRERTLEKKKGKCGCRFAGDQLRDTVFNRL